MAAPVPVDDPGDERVADYRHLTDAALRRLREEPGPGGRHGIFVTEGALAIRRLLRSDYRVRSVLVTPAQLGALADDLAGLDAPVYVAGRAVMAAVAGFDVHRGALASADRRPLPPPEALFARARRVAVLEEVNDHENLGGTFRNAAAFGLDAVLLCPRCADPLYRRSVRVSVGHVLGVPFARLDPWPGALGALRDAGFALVALTPDPTAEPLRRLDPASLGRVALLLGAEGPGLSAAALARADRRVRIPMAPGVDSLNVAAASAVAFAHLADLG